MRRPPTAALSPHDPAGPDHVNAGPREQPADRAGGLSIRVWTVRRIHDGRPEGRRPAQRRGDRQMAKFLLTYTGGSMPETEAAQAQAAEAWGVWFGQLGAA